MEFLGEFGNRGIAAFHGGLGETNLSLGEGKLPATFSPSGAGGFESREGALADQFALELRQGGEDTEDEAVGVVVLICAPWPARTRRADPTFREPLYDTHQVVQVAPEAIKLPDDQGIALAQCLETGRETGTAVLLARGAVLIDEFLVHACLGQGVILKIEVLCVPGFGDASISDVHVLYGRILLANPAYSHLPPRRTGTRAASPPCAGARPPTGRRR